MVVIVAFPGTNCDQDTYHALTDVLGQKSKIVWHQERNLGEADVVILPGGFAHGDYLRCGAIARFSPIMEAVREHAERGRLLIGICNGMQILLELGLLPGALLRNEDLEFKCHWVHLRVEAKDTYFLGDAVPGTILRLPISHGEGRYHCDPLDLVELAEQGQILLRYCNSEGIVNDLSNPNGSAGNIAGLRNYRGNVFGLMPHPERACEALLGGTDGLLILRSLVEAKI